LLSLFTQLMTAIAGWLFLRDFHPLTTFADALFIVPLAAATTFLPITVGGTGAREAVFITLCGELLGMSSNDALATSLLVWLTSLIVGAVGGVLQLVGDKRERGAQR
jgi:glycosyltransferase 2 family protein